MFAILLTLALGQNDYTTAYQEANQTNKPLIVMVTGDGCEGCKVMKREVFPRIFKKIRRNRVAYAEVDAFSEVGRKCLSGGNSIPLIVVYQNNKEYKRFTGNNKSNEDAIEKTLSELTNAD